MKMLCKDVPQDTLIVLEVVDNSIDERWYAPDEIKNIPPVSLLYRGQFVHEDKEFIRIADVGVSTGGLKNIHVIPKAGIVWIDVVTKVKRIYENKVFEACFEGN